MTTSRNAEYEALYARIAAVVQAWIADEDPRDQADILSEAGHVITTATARITTLRDHVRKSRAAGRVLNAAHIKPRRGSHAKR